MKLKKYIIIFIALIMLLNIACINAADSDEKNIYVDSSIGNDDNTGENWQTPIQTIEKAIQLTPNNHKTNIYLNNGTYSGENNTKIIIENKNTVNIIGSVNTIIDGENRNHIFTITNNTKISLQNIQFINAYINDTQSKSSVLNIENNSQIEIKNCQFTNNACNIIQNNTASINAKDNKALTMENCTFTNETLQNQYIKPLIKIENTETLTMKNTLIKNITININLLPPFNIKSNLLQLINNKKITLQNNYISDISSKINIPQVINITKINNIAHYSFMPGFEYLEEYWNISSYKGYAPQQTAYWERVMKSSVEYQIIKIDNTEKLNFTENKIENNFETPGTLLIINNTENIIFYNNIITNNTSKNHEQKKSTIESKDFNTELGSITIENSKKLEIRNNTLNDNSALDKGSLFFLNKIENAEIKNNTLLNNYGKNNGIIYLTGNEKISITNNKISNNKGDNKETIWIESTKQVNITNTYFNYNKNTMTLYNTTATINNITLKNNNGNLGNIKINNSTVTINNSLFTDNTANHGGVIYNEGNLTIINSKFKNNNAKLSIGTMHTFSIGTEFDGGGGDIYNNGNALLINITSTNSEDFTLGFNTIGGSIFNKGTIILNNSEISNKKAGEYSYGSAISNIGDCTIINSTIKDNSISLTSESVHNIVTGAVHNEGILTATQSIFQNNMPTLIAVHVHAASFTRGSGNIYNTETGMLDITNCIFINKQVYLNGSWTKPKMAFGTKIMQDIYSFGKIISLENNYWNGENPNTNQHTNYEKIRNYYLLECPDYIQADINESKIITLNFTPQNNNNNVELPFEKINLTIKSAGKTLPYNITNRNITFEFNQTQEKGSYPITVTFPTKEQKVSISRLSDRDYYKAPVDKTVELLIDCGKEHAKMDVNLNNSTKIGENITFDVKVSGNYTHQPTGKITIYFTDITTYRTTLTGDKIKINTVRVADKKFTLNLTDSQAHFNMKLFEGAGTANLKIVYEGDEDYFKEFYYNTTTVNKLSPELKIEMPEVYVGEELQINLSKAKGSERSTGYISIDGARWSNIIYNQDNITLNYRRTTWLNNHGNYTIKITYDETANYQKSTITANLIVKRYETNLTLNASDIMVGQNLLINMSITPEEVGGEVNITINNQTLTPAYINGTKTWTYNITNLKAGTYNITATFNGNKKYAPTTITKTITVHRYPSNLTVKQTINDNLTGTITTQAQGTGNITVWINDKKYTQKNNNTNIFNVEYINGTNYIYIHYTGDDTYDSATWNTTMNITYKYFLKAENITYYQNEEFNYTITLLDGKLKPLDDYVNITFNNTQYKIKTVNGTIQFPLKLPKGTYNITIQYNQSTITNTINITTADTNPNMTIKTNNITYTEKLQITINITKGATGTITIKIHNQTQTIKIQNNKVTATFENIPAGNQTVTATYNGDNKYRIITENKTIQIKKAQSTIKITTGNITIGENIFIYATTNKGTTGNVTFRIIGQYSPRNRTLENNKATWYISPLNRGQYTITAIYCGDNNYNPSNTTYTITVDPEINLTINTQDTEYGEEILIEANVNPELKGQINFQIANINQNVTIENGKATLKIQELNAGTYNIKATFLSENFQSTPTNKKITIKPTNPISDIYIKDILAGEDETIQITLKNDSLKYKIFIDNKEYGKLNITIPKLTKGEHTLTVEVTGNNNYKNQTQTIKFYAKTQTSTINITTQNITYHENLNIKATITENATGTITYKIANNTITTQDKEISIKNLAAGTYTLTVTYNGDSHYQSSTTTTTITVYKTTPTMNVELNASTPEDPVNITVKINTDATGNITYRIYGLYSPRNKTIINGQSNWLIEPLEMGEYELIVIYNGDNNYNPTNITKIININQIKSYLTHNITINPDNSLTVTAELTTTENNTINTDITLRIGNKFYRMKITNNTGLFTTPELTPGNYRYSLAYAGTTEISSSNNNGAFTIKETVTLESNTTVNNNTATIQIHSSKDNINITLTINNTEYPITIKNNTATIQIDLKPGQYTYTIKYDGNELAKTANTTGTFTIKQTPEITYTLEINPDNSITLHINSTIKDTNLTLEINGKNYLIKITNGTGLYTTPELNPDNYTYHIIYDGDKLTKGIEKSGQFELKNNAQLEVKNLTKYYSSTDRLNMTLTQKNRPIANETIYITINGATYKRTTNTEGKTSIAINLASGNYTATITFNNTQYNPITKNIQINIKNTIYGDDITKVYKNDTQYYAIFTDNTGKLLKNTTVTFNINGVFYERTTNQEGIAKLNINLQQGTYILTATNPLTNEQYSNTITVLSKIQENSDLTKYYRNSSQYTVKIIKSNGQTAKTGEKVTFNINGVFYERYTDENGYAKLNINLQPGDYIITAEYDGCKVSNNITVLTILKAYNLAKKYGTTIPFTATLLDGEGNPLANEKITFNINGVFYQRTTNNQGMAKLNINLQQGKYIITSSYNGLNVANVVTVH